ncbi:hypothetical protein MKEN_01182400 [Mycena kentingensis (nom. inval.)]|nr:hypothetical protein MKEN_01182400 [Mycena kentingensis (nom. inval.)]
MRLQSHSVVQSGAVRQSLRLLANVGDAANVGVLKGFAGVVNLVLDICETATSNKVEADALAADVAELVMVVATHVEELQQPQLGADAELLLQDIAMLCGQLEAVDEVLKNLFCRDSSLSWFVKHSRDEARLQRLQRDIKHAIDLFSFQSSVRLQRRLVRSAALSTERNDKLLEDIAEVCKQVMDELKLAKQGNEPPSPVVMASGPVLPRAPRHFYGREDTVKTVVNMVVGQQPARVAILGAAGIGKTSVAAMVLFSPEVVEQFGNRRFFISCDAAKNKDDVLTAIAGPLGLHGSKLQKKILDAFGDPQEQFLLVLDNFESPWEGPDASKKEVESLLVALCSLDSLTVVITLRGSERPGGVKWTRPTLPQLGPLDSPSARKVFLALSDCAEEDQGIDALLSAVDNVPLAIALMANLAETDSTEQLSKRWHEEQSSLLNRVEDRTSSLDVSIRISLNSPRMNAVPEAAALLRLVSLLPDGIDHGQLVAIFPHIPKARRALAALWQTSLAYNDGHGRTRILSPIRAHMIFYHPPDIQQRTPMLTFYMGLAELCSDLGGPHGQDIVKKLTPEIGNLHAIVDLVHESASQQAGDEQLLRSAVVTAINLSKFTRYTHLGGQETLRTARDIARKLGGEKLLADVLYHSAWTTLLAATDGDTTTHEALCSEALAIYVRLGDMSGQAECTWLMAQIKKATKRQKECRPLWEEALKLAVASQNVYCQAKCLSCLSEITFYGGDASAAERLSQEALVLFRQLDHLTNIGMSCFMLGKIAAFRDDPAADAYFDEAELVLKQAGAYSQAGAALIGKGDRAFARCQYQTAQTIYLKAKTTFEEANMLASNYAFALLSIGTAAAYLHEYAEAAEWLGQATNILKKTSFMAYGNLHCDIIYGDLAFYEHKFEDAASLYRRALLSAETLGFAEEEALCHVKLGRLEVAEHRVETGLRHLVVAASKQRRSKDVKGLSQTLVRLGECYASTDHNTSISFFRAAYPVCQKMNVRNLADCLLGMGRVLGDRGMVGEAERLYAETGDKFGQEECKRVLSG